MKTFNITIEETVSQTFEIEADSLEEAMEIAEQKYDDCEIVLEPRELVNKQMKGYDAEAEEETSWVEF